LNSRERPHTRACSMRDVYVTEIVARVGSPRAGPDPRFSLASSMQDGFVDARAHLRVATVSQYLLPAHRTSPPDRHPHPRQPYMLQPQQFSCATTHQTHQLPSIYSVHAHTSQAYMDHPTPNEQIPIWPAECGTERLCDRATSVRIRPNTCPC